MRQLSVQEKNTALAIARSCFEESINHQFLFGERLFGWRFNLFLRRSIRFARKKNGAFIANDGRGVVLIIPVTSSSTSYQPINWWSSLLFIPFQRLVAVNRFQRTIRSFQPAEPHLHFLLLATQERQQGISAIIEMRDDLFAMSELMQLPIYAQTSSKRARDLYERFGFTTYAQTPIPGSSEQLYFVKRVPPATV